MSTGALEVVFVKLLPAAIGAWAMMLVEPRRTWLDYISRMCVALAFAYLFGDAIFIYVDTQLEIVHDAEPWQKAISGLTGCAAFAIMGGVNELLRRLRKKIGALSIPGLLSRPHDTGGKCDDK